MAMALIPIVLPMIPELYKIVKELVDALQSGTLSEEEKQAKYAEISARLEARMQEVEGYKFKDV